MHSVHSDLLCNKSPFLNICFIEDIIQVLRNQGRGEGGGMAKYYTLITEGGGGMRKLQN